MCCVELYDKGIRRIAQYNTYHPQLVVYDSSPLGFNTGRIATCAILKYFSFFSH